MIEKKLIPTVILTILLILSLNVSAEETVNVDIIPEKPQPMGSVEITANIDDADITNVFIVVQECDADTGICYEKENYSMTNIQDNTYSSSINLGNEGATYLQYTINVQTSDGWNTYNENTKVNYDLSSVDNGGNDNSDSDTPGFSFIVLSVSIIFILMILHRRNR